MPSTVNRRCDVYILAFGLRSRTVTLKFLLILLNKGYRMLNNTKTLQWYRNLWSLCVRMTTLTICRCPGFGGCIFLNNLVLKARYGALWSFFWHMDTRNCNLSKTGSKNIAILFCKTWNRILKACFFLFLFLSSCWEGLDGFVGCINLTYLRDSLTNIRIRVLSPGRSSLGRMPHSPYYFF